MKLKINDYFPYDIVDDATIMDYVEDSLVFIMKDEFWCDEELQALNHQALTFEFLCMYDIPLFLITIGDIIDTSDFNFNPCACDELDKLLMQDNLHVEIYLLAKDNKICGKKAFDINKSHSELIKNRIKECRDNYLEEAFICNLEGLQSSFQPFELSDKAILREQH